MKAKELGKIVDKYVRSIEKYSKRIPGSFTIEDIHDLRVDYKRLRAFIRLCREEAQAKHLLIPEALKEVYKAAGAVRDHQLFLAKISLYTKIENALPQFTQCIQRNLFSAKEALIQQIEKVEWNKLRKSMKDELPAVLHDTAIRQFVNRKVAGIHILLMVAEREEDLHDMRKNYKDLLLGARVFEHDWAIPFPFPAWKTEKAAAAMAEKLGDFNDECITLSFLESHCQENLTGNERVHIATWRNMQQQQVETDKKKLLLEVRQVRLTAPAIPIN